MTGLTVVVGLSAPTVPILLAGGVEIAAALSAWSVWLIGFAATTMAVHAVIAAQKRRPRSLHAVALSIVCLGVAVAIALDVETLLATVPMILISWWLVLFPPAAKHLKRIGWASVAATTATAVALLATFAAAG